MKHNNYLLPDGQKLSILWSSNLRKAAISVDGTILHEIKNTEEAKSGISLMENRLKIRFNQSKVIGNLSGIEIWWDGELVPGSVLEPEVRYRDGKSCFGVYALYSLIGGFFLTTMMLSYDYDGTIANSLWLVGLDAVVYITLWYFITKRSSIAFLIASFYFIVTGLIASVNSLQAGNVIQMIVRLFVVFAVVKILWDAKTGLEKIKNS